MDTKDTFCFSEMQAARQLALAPRNADRRRKTHRLGVIAQLASLDLSDEEQVLNLLTSVSKEL